MFPVIVFPGVFNRNSTIFEKATGAESEVLWLLQTSIGLKLESNFFSSPACEGGIGGSVVSIRFCMHFRSENQGNS